ncbi:MAG TPA: hypothetical protein VF785_23760 [Gemmatimonadaceae bacterium]
MTSSTFHSPLCGFPAGTLIRMADGSERAIERVRPNEHVVTAEGRTGIVKQWLARCENKAIIRLMIWGHAPLCVSAEHRVLTKRGYVQVGDLRRGDQVGLTMYLPEPRGALETSDVLPTRERSAAVPDRIPLSPRFGRLVGFFLGAAATSRAPLHFMFGLRDRASLADECMDLFHDVGADAELGPGASTWAPPVIVRSSEWLKWAARLFGKREADRVVHPLLMGNDDFLRAMLDGWLACDGYAGHATPGAEGRRGSTLSKPLAYGMYDIAQALGLRPAISLCPPNRERQHWSYEVEADGKCGDRATSEMESCELDETHVWRRVRGSEERAFDEMVYNLSVEGDESYVAEGVAVHNCAAET